MIKSGNSMRFTPQEVDAYREAGIGVDGVKTQADFGHEVEQWAHTLAEEKPALLEKIAAEMARLKGAKLPPKLAVVKPSSDSPSQS